MGSTSLNDLSIMMEQLSQYFMKKAIIGGYTVYSLRQATAVYYLYAG